MHIYTTALSSWLYSWKLLLPSILSFSQLVDLNAGAPKHGRPENQAIEPWALNHSSGYPECGEAWEGDVPDVDHDEAEQGTWGGTAEGPGSQATANEIFVGYELGES